MNVFTQLTRRLFTSLFPLKEMAPADAYNLWSARYDDQPGNLMLDLDKNLFLSLAEDVPFKNKIIADVGCGTGRHWNHIYQMEPKNLKGYDVSQGMLKALGKKFPHAKIYHLKNNHLQCLQGSGCDIIVCTLALAHIQNIDDAFAEWNRALKQRADIILTDYHPLLLSKGGNRTFVYHGKTIAIKNYIHSIEKLKSLAKDFSFRENKFIEVKIDAAVKHYYEEQKALHIYERFKETPLIYGLHLTRSDVTT